MAWAQYFSALYSETQKYSTRLVAPMPIFFSTCFFFLLPYLTPIFERMCLIFCAQ